MLHQLRQALPDADRFLVADTRTAGGPRTPVALDVARFDAAVSEAARSRGEAAARAALDGRWSCTGDPCSRAATTGGSGRTGSASASSSEAAAGLVPLEEASASTRARSPSSPRLLREPIDEEARRWLMRVLALAGDRAARCALPPLRRDPGPGAGHEPGAEPRLARAALRDAEPGPSGRAPTATPGCR